MLVLGFLTSLLPGYNFNPEDAAAFAAGQAIAAREGEQQQPAGRMNGAGAGNEGGAQQQPPDNAEPVAAM